MIKIDKNVPLPRRRGIRIYPVSDLNVGESFLVERPRNPLNLAQTLYQAAKRAGYKVSVVQVGRNVRCWRIA